ncbi:DUF3891 family protein [Virgibacillus sp. C22-A2]|uniref:DUF3891 family protein n=1 Tax=Virgibacillus tibetensis TaxID=3042313 RepID=A0ABU6KK70_9BACI|nr:DUF3891 family protein [Virgibacillus sp. C22-A2]
MIVREHDTEFVMIEQDNHAQVSGKFIANCQDSLFPGMKYKNSVDHAIFQHDCGWKPVDKQPFWNDQKKTPYSFIDFPTPSKVMLYTSGIDEVEKADSYAGLLCSEHYKRFLMSDMSEDAQLFVEQEKIRQHRIIDSLTEFDAVLFNFHYELLQFCDNLSLYICLNEPGEDTHPFFKSGIPMPSALDVFSQDKMKLTWEDDRTISLSEFPFHREIDVSFIQKTVTKQAIRNHGLIESYNKAPDEEISIRFIGS